MLPKGGIKVLKVVFSYFVAGFTAYVVKFISVAGDANFLVMVVYICCYGDITTVVLDTGPLICSCAMDTLLLWMNLSSCSFIYFNSSLLAKSSA